MIAQIPAFDNLYPSLLLRQLEKLPPYGWLSSSSWGGLQPSAANGGDKQIWLWDEVKTWRSSSSRSSSTPNILCTDDSIFYWQQSSLLNKLPRWPKHVFGKWLLFRKSFIFLIWCIVVMMHTRSGSCFIKCLIRDYRSGSLSSLLFRIMSSSSSCNT